MCRTFMRLSIAAFVFVACSPVSVRQAPPAVTAIPSATHLSTNVPVTPTVQPEPAPEVNWPTSLEFIQSANWSRLQLLKTFPAEMPLLNSAVAISPDGKTMAVGSNSRAQIFFFDLPNGQLSRTITVNGVANVDAPFHKLEYLSDRTLVANSDGPYRIYQINVAGDVLASWESSSFAISADRRIMAYGRGAGVTLVDLLNGTTLSSFPADYAVDYSFSPDNSMIAVNVVGVDYADTVIWDLVNQKELTKLVETGNPRFSPDGKFLAVSSYQESTVPLKIFSASGTTEIATLHGTLALWSPDGSVLTAQLGNSPAAAWDTTNWQPLDSAALQGELYAFSPDGRILITRTSDGGILLWGVVS